MSMSLADEIKQAKPFASAKEELWLNLLRTTGIISHEMEQNLRPRGLSPTQYNVLRILRGAGAEGLCQYEIRDRLVAQVPDVPRILERMEKAGWIKRNRGEADRRMVIASATEEGLRLVGDLDQPMVQWMNGLFGELEEMELEQLSELLGRARARD
ncbi:MarR family winged helix-turn-helix transcriptional regulator [Granulicella tundricola]|uniref:Regulatory protein MarR n=1 Tax=Granulicella tundricola (strain ATCC BAA-1859 / DSM 23138 / MP5ACTX9) TaxID=1198114 RepID=E8X0J3_GRATM|nr:MarR family transcriptional regulator [Granulicella tundricola]ADW67857.1 regulatory protein MarR [Granulicella tundricola MP5ACTX9]